MVSLVLGFSQYANAQIHERTDTLYIQEAAEVPVVDGIPDDEAWGLAEWQAIDKVWIPYGADISADVFEGQFKVLWSSETNLLYFLVETRDDVFVDGYTYPNTGYPNYDIVEVFIDEDRSGGRHVFDDGDENAENSFSYHIAADALGNEEIQNEFLAMDIWGSNWSDYVAEYSDHFPGFAMWRSGDNFTWEFSLIVHDDTYDHNNQQASQVDLTEGKVMGLSMAYCNNDDPTGELSRDHFFGSVDVPESANNSHWENADWFGVSKLVVPTVVSSPGQSFVKKEKEVKVVHSGENISIEVNSGDQGILKLRMFDMTGVEVLTEEGHKNQQGTWRKEFATSRLSPGIYIVGIVIGDNRYVEKIVVQ